MNLRLVKFIECELDRNAWLFAQSYGSLIASIDFIDNVLTKENWGNLNEEEEKYIYKLRAKYRTITNNIVSIQKALADYKDAYIELFSDELL